MRKINAIIADDESDAIDVLSNLLKEFNFVEIVTTVNNSLKIESAVNRYQPDLIFLDINMPGINGIQLLENLRQYNHNIEVVIVTAHQHYILESINYNISGYLLKPVNRGKLESILLKIRSKHDNEGENDLIGGKFKIPVREGYVFVNLEDILFFEAEGNYTQITLSDTQVYVSSYNMGRLFKRVPEHQFVRVNRGCIMNFKYLYKIDKKKKICIAKANGKTYECEASSAFLSSLNKVT